MKKGTKIALILAITYCSLATHQLLLSIGLTGNFLESSFPNWLIDFLIPGYILGFILGYSGGSGAAIIGQIITFILLFYLLKNIFNGMLFKQKDSVK